MATIGLARVDFRLIHGQVVVKWIKQISADIILIIDNNLVKDKFMSSIIVNAAPPNITIKIMDIDTAVSSWKENKIGEGRVLVLFKSVSIASQAWHKGLPLPALQLGGLGGGPGRKVAYNNITLSKEDVELLDEMAEKGVEITLQAIPEERPMAYKEALKRVKF